MTVLHDSPRTARLWPVLALALVGAAAGWRAWPAPPADAPVWPPPPDVPRIRFVAAIAEPKDVGAGGSWFGRAASAILGRKRQPRIVRPRAMAVDGSGRLLVADPEQRIVHVFDVAGRKYSYLEPAPFASPVGIAVGPGDAIYVTDSERRRVFVYGPNGKLRNTLGVRGGEPVFVRPTGIAVGPDGRLHVVDTVACTITTMTTRGDVVRVVGQRGAGDGEFNYPTDIAVGRDNRVWVVDSLNARLQVLDADGRFVRRFGRRGNGTGDIDKPKGVALDSDGHVYVAEGMHDVVQIFDQEGRLLLVVGASGNGRGQFCLPAGVSMDAADRLYVADALNGRVQVFQYIRQPDAR